MSAICITIGRMAKDSMLKFRCEQDLRVRFDRVAALLRRTSADLGRLVFEDYIASEERRLGLAGALHEAAPAYFVPKSLAATKPVAKIHKLSSSPGSTPSTVPPEKVPLPPSWDKLDQAAKHHAHGSTAPGAAAASAPPPARSARSKKKN